MFVDKENHIDIAMPMYNLIEYSDNYSNTLRSLWQFKRDQVPGNIVDLSICNSKSFEYKAVLVGKTAEAVENTNRSVKNSCSIKVLKSLFEISKNAINYLQNPF